MYTPNLYRQAKVEGARAAFKTVSAAFTEYIEYLAKDENGEVFTPEQKKAVIAGISCMLTSVKHNCEELERRLQAEGTIH